MEPTVKIDVYSHGLRVYGYSTRLFEDLTRYLDGLTIKDTRRLYTGEWVTEIKKTFFTTTKNQRELFLHRTAYDELRAVLTNLNISEKYIQVNQIEVPEYKPAVMQVWDHLKPREYQVPLIAKVTEDIPEGQVRSRALFLQTGKGKGLPLQTPVRVPNGWKAIGDLSVSDEVIARDGTTTKVTGVYPQGIMPCYRMEFSDGREIVSDESHQWAIKDKRGLSVCSTLDLFDKFRIAESKMMDKPTITIPMVIPEKEGQKEKIKTCRAFVKKYKPGYYPAIGDHSVFLIIDKSINDENETDSFIETARSLGAYASVFKENEDSLILMIVHRYMEIFSPVNFQLKTIKDNELRLQIKKITKVEDQETVCISVDHPEKLFVIKDYIVTHNTYVSLKSASELGRRTQVVLYPKYFGIWKEALTDTYKGFEDRYVEVSGGKSLQAAIKRALADDFDYDFILMSSVTYRKYIETYMRFYKDFQGTGYLVPPTEFHKTLGIGFQINDEIQEDPALIYRIDSFTNVERQVYLSATPYTGDKTVTLMIEKMLPPDTQCPLPELDVYIDVIAIQYNDGPLSNKDYQQRGKGTYNHAQYEKNLSKNKRRLVPYLNMVNRAVNGLFINDCEPKQKMLILCATVDFIKKLVVSLQKEFPDKDIVGYHAGVSYKVLESADIIVSTIQSAGTGVDIPNLREVLLLKATDSKKDNVQILGRLRRMIDFPEHTPRLSYMVNREIVAHHRYHMNRMNHFNKRVLTHRNMRI